MHTYMHAYLLHLYVKSFLEEGGCHTCCPLEICCGKGTPNDNQWTPHSHQTQHKHSYIDIHKKHKQSLDIGIGIGIDVDINMKKYKHIYMHTYMHAYLLHLYVKSILEEGGCNTCCTGNLLWQVHP